LTGGGRFIRGSLLAPQPSIKIWDAKIQNLILSAKYFIKFAFIQQKCYLAYPLSAEKCHLMPNQLFIGSEMSSNANLPFSAARCRLMLKTIDTI